MPDKRKSFIKGALAVIVLTSAALYFISPVLSGIRNIGMADWDSHLFFHAVPVRTVLEYGQFPLWNPYYCGGSPMLASPESGFLSPPFVFALIFGEVVGVKLITVFFTVLGFWGMYYLSRTLGFGRLSSFLPPAVFMMSSWYTLRVTEGHSGFLPFALLPFAAAFYIRSIEVRGTREALKTLIPSALFLAWMIFAGGVYPFIITAFFLSIYALLSAVSRMSLRPVINLALIAILAFLFSAVKTVPQYEFIREFPRKTEALQYHSPRILKDSLFKRDQQVTGQDPSFYQGPGESDEEYLRAFWGGRRPWGWHEYGAFVGFISFALYLAGFVSLRRTWIWIAVSLLSLLLSMGDFAPINLWSILRRLPVFSSLHGPSRITILFVFALSVVAGYALSGLEEGRSPLKNRLKAHALVTALILALSLEMITVSRPVLKDAFTLPPYDIKEKSSFTQLVVKDPAGTNYPYFLQNIGVVNCYESQHPGGRVTPYGDDSGRLNPAYRGEAYVVGAGEARVTYFSPNSVTVNVRSQDGARVVLNQNYFRGWKARVDGRRYDAEPYEGLVSVKAQPGTREVAFYYSPESFWIGLLLSSLSIVSSVIYLAVSGRKRGRDEVSQ